ncbi:hypothetical protein L3C95_16680 [Chitinophaga filiformis]|uniref:hypothetical protein n=1 Tax=Chitinophaga filiformis TaxID=104663 RepID=UPI001F308547|nr:hypothetical protein [Chitinophaga filiformis]MCF6404534.1 hypothetical protein [Chitinophaga filiformis]
MKKHLVTLGLLIVSGAFVYFQSLPAPSFAATAGADKAYTTYNDYFRQDTIPRSDTSKHKMKKHKMKTDSTWRRDSVPH